MNEKKHIDRLFQESFKDFEETPSDAVWENIETKLNQKKKKRRVIPIWWRYAGAAALLVLLLTIGGVYFNASGGDTQTNQVVDTENSASEEVKTTNPLNNNTEIRQTVVTDNNTQDDLDKSLISPNKTALPEEPIIAENSASKNKTEYEANSASLKTPLNKNVIANNNNTQQHVKKGTESKHQIPSNKTSLSEESAIAKASTSENKLNASNYPNNAIANNSEKQIKNNIVYQLQNKSKNEAAISSTLQKEEKQNQTIIKNDDALINHEKAKRLINNNTSTNDNSAIAEVKKEATEAILNDQTKENELTIEEALDKNKDIIDEKDNSKKWSISTNAAPVYFNTLGEGSSIDPQLNSNSKSGELNISYGVSASYAINNKLSVRSGINKLNLGYNTNDLVVFQSVGLSTNSSLRNVNSRANNDETVSLISAESFDTNSAIPETFTSSNSSINQTIGYIEIPLELKYTLSDKRLGVNVIGGFSSFFLNNNEIFSESENGARTFIGEANNINKVSYSANFGFGLNYQISKKIDLNLEPIFKYQINTFNNTSGDFKPFFIGAYTGFTIKF